MRKCQNKKYQTKKISDTGANYHSLVPINSIVTYTFIPIDNLYHTS